MSRFFTRQAVKINMDYKQFLNKISEPLDCQPAEKKTKKAMTQSSPIKFTYKDLYRCLYRQNGIEALNTMLIKQNGLPTASKAQATYCKLTKSLEFYHIICQWYKFVALFTLVRVYMYCSLDNSSKLIRLSFSVIG